MNEGGPATIAPEVDRSAVPRLRNRLFFKYVALFLAVVLVALLTSGAFQVWFYHQEHKASLIRIQREQAEAAAAKISQFISEIERQVGWTAQLPWSEPKLDQRRFDALRLLRQVPAITELSQLDTRGREQLRVSRLAIDVIGSEVDYSNDPKFTEAMAKKVYYGPVYFRRESEPYMTLALAGARRDAGVSVAEVNLKLIWDVVSRIKVGEKGHAYVVDANGRLIAHPDISLVLRNTDLSGLSQVKAARAAAAGEASDHVQEAVDIHGRDVLTAYAAVAPLGWLVFVELPFQEAYAPLRASIERLALLLLSGLLLALLAGLFLAGRMVGPVRALRAGALRLGGGDLSQRIAVKTGDELEALADQFNDMAGRLQESYSDLERRVELRTTELAKSVRELRALGEVSQAVNSTLDLESVLDTIVAKAVQLSGTEAGAIYVSGEGQEELRLRATHGMSEDMIAALVARGVGFSEVTIAEAIAQRAPAQISDLRDGPTTPVREIVLRAGYRALLVVPLLSPDGIVGTLVVRRRAPGVFPQSTIDLLQTFAAQSVVAIRNARLFSEVEEKRQQLAAASQHKSQFLANMSHELRTPLNAIIGYSELLRDEIEATGEERFTPDLKRIEQSGRHLLGLINDILDLSKIEAGRMDVFLEDVEIAPLLEEVRAIIKPLAEKNGNVLELRLADNLDSMRTDRTKLKQSLLNVLSNASKFTENGRVTLAAERVEADRPMIRFTVADTGIGMTEAQLGRLFQAFSQIHASGSQKYGGTGLGLTITQHFCQLLGGDIEAASRPGEGSTFTITLPARTAMATPIESADISRFSPDQDHATTVLVVDDDPAARDLLTANLKGAGYRLIHAATGEEAMKLARTMRPDAITLDVLMPKMDGWAVLSALKADAELRDIPVVMVTVVAERGLGLSLGAVDFLTKPVDRGDLVTVLHRLLRRDGVILVVEDETATRTMIRHTIEKMGLMGAEAANGRSALAWLADNPMPAAIVLDLMMPEMDGFELLDALMACDHWRDIPIVVVTAKQLTAVERERLLREAQQVIIKGASIGIDVAAAVGEAVRRRPPSATADA